MDEEYELVFYEDENGYSEVAEFIQTLSNSSQKADVTLLKKIVHQFNMLKILGNELNEPQSKQLTEYDLPIMELRPMPECIFYASWQGDKYVILHHYTKKQNYTDPKEVKKVVEKIEDW